MQTLIATHKLYIIFEMLPSYVNRLHINIIIMHNADYKSDPLALYYIWNVTMLRKQIAYKHHKYAQCRL